MIGFQHLYVFILLLFFVSNEFAQSKSNSDAEWTRIKDDKLEFSILFPSNFLVDNEIEKSYILAPVLASLPEVIDSFEKPKIIGNKKSVIMSLSVFQLRQVSNAKNYLWYFVGRDTPKDKYQDFQVGDFVGRRTSFDTEKTLAMSVAVAVKNKVFLINAPAKNEDEKIYEKFLMSLMINGKPLFKSQTSESSDAAQSVFISTLQTSPEILEALNQKPEKSEIKVVKSLLTQQEENTDERSFSRPLIILRKPYFEFVDVASKNKYSGLVKLRINFLSSGKIGDIFVVSDSPEGLTKIAIKAAQKIKFLAAEIDGKKVDVTRTIEYAFNVR
jgi:hypothetical protein